MSCRRAPSSGRVVGLVVLTLVLALAGCATTVPLPRSVAPAAVAFTFAADTFEFPNHIRARDPDRPDLYANYCFVLARAIRQFHSGARFDPTAPKLDAAGYVERVRQIAARTAWDPPLPPSERVVIPGYRNLREFSRDQERAVKAGLGGRFWTWVHWTNWRVTLSVDGAHQENVAREIVNELAAGRLVQLLVTNWPNPELNHTVVAFAVRERQQAVDFDVWDPNEPNESGIITFDRTERRFVATRMYATEVGPIRAFRMYYTWFL